MIPNHLFICHQLCTILTTDSAIKYHALSSVQTRNVQLCEGRVGNLSTFFCVISGFRRHVHEVCDHLQSYAAWTGNPIPTFRANLLDRGSAPSGTFMPTCRNLTVETGLKGCPETSVRNYHAAPREIPHKSGFQVLCSFSQSFEFVPNTFVYY